MITQSAETRSTLPESDRRHRTTRDLTAAERRLAQIISEHQFGRLENFPVEAGQPVLDQGMKIVRVARLGGENAGTTVPTTNEFELKQAACDLFDELARLWNGTVIRLEFRRGLPCLIEIAVPATDELADGAQLIEVQAAQARKDAGGERR